ncbi:MAG: hypothetical protein CO107_01215 [Deltaproteobacteria bacterium CG_4_9_14_3_um_filter_51_14]|nr:MAG: hypothetical protein CO107_01215 [Deltaproteobacteria bacterium CG_4_9_14_3_um_filter_51_14]
MNDFDLEQMLQDLRKELPALLSRREASRIAKLSCGTLANLDSKKEGPPRAMLETKVVYPREGFILWLGQRLRPIV